jgi:hypothetical protein
MKHYLIGISICTVCFFSFQYTFSQTPNYNLSELINSSTGLPIGIEEQVSVEQIPKIPKPNEFVSIRVTSYLTDLNKAKITWTQDGKVLLSQTGAVTNQIQAPESGKTSTLTITIQKENGGIITKKITLSPADVDLLYEAQTYTHPFFKGKRLFTSEAPITFIAVPNFVIGGKKVAAENLVYTWKINGTVEQSISGYGKNTFSMQGSLIERPLQITVEVSALNSTLTASQQVVVRSTQPEILLYENNPLLGVIYEQAVIGDFLLERNQIDFEAVPYFFSALTKNDNDLIYDWAINGVKVTSKAPNENYLLLQNNDNEEGRALISATVRHAQKILQTTKTNLNLDFKKVNESTNEEITF